MFFIYFPWSLKKDQIFLSELQAYEPKNIKKSIAYISNQHF